MLSHKNEKNVVIKNTITNTTKIDFMAKSKSCCNGKYLNTSYNIK